MVDLAAMLAGLGAVLGAAVAVAHVAVPGRGPGFGSDSTSLTSSRDFVFRSCLRARQPGSYAVLPALFLWILGVRAALVSLRRPLTLDDPLHTDLFLTGWLLVSAIAVTAGGRFFGHYFHQTTAPLSVLAAPAAVRLARTRPRLVGAAVGIPTAAFFLLGLLHSQVMAAAGDPDPDYRAIAAYVDARSAPSDSLVVWETRPCSTSKPVDRSAAGSCLNYPHRAFASDAHANRSERRRLSQRGAGELGHVRGRYEGTTTAVLRRHLTGKYRGLRKVLPPSFRACA